MSQTRRFTLAPVTNPFLGLPFASVKIPAKELFCFVRSLVSVRGMFIDDDLNGEPGLEEAKSMTSDSFFLGLRIVLAARACFVVVKGLVRLRFVGEVFAGDDAWMTMSESSMSVGGSELRSDISSDWKYFDWFGFRLREIAEIESSPSNWNVLAVGCALCPLADGLARTGLRGDR